MANNRNNRFDKIREKIDKRTPSRRKIKEKDYSLNPGRYVGVDNSNQLSEEELNEQLKQTATELFTLMDESKELEEKVREILKNEIK